MKSIGEGLRQRGGGREDGWEDGGRYRVIAEPGPSVRVLLLAHEGT